jgi:hypothetical protein
MAAFVFRQSPILWTHNTCEEKLGTGIPTVLQGNIVAILLNAVRKRRDNHNGILHTCSGLVYTTIHWFIPVYTRYISVYTGIYKV